MNYYIVWTAHKTPVCSCLWRVYPSFLQAVRGTIISRGCIHAKTWYRSTSLAATCSSLVVHYDHVDVECQNNGPSEQGQAGPQRDGRLRFAEDPKRLVKSALIM